MTGYLYGYIIVNVAYNVLIVGQFANMISLPLSNTVGSDICFVIIEIEFAIFYTCFWVQVEIYCAFTTVFGFVLDTRTTNTKHR